MTYRSPAQRRIPIDAHDAIVWSMDNGTAPITSIGSSTSISLSGTASFLATGVFNTSILFDNDVLSSLDSNIEPLATSFTFSCWVFLREYGSGTPIIISKSYHTIGEGWSSPFGISITISSSLDGYWDAGGQTASLHITDKIELEAWQNLAFTWDGYWIRAYLNGSEVASDHTNMTSIPLAFDFGSHGPWQVGGNAITNSDYINGYIDDIRISNIARDAVYLDRQYRWGVGRFDNETDNPVKFFADFSSLPLGRNDNTSFNNATGLQFTRSSAATVQIGKTNIDITAISDEPRIGSIDANWGRGLVFEESRENFALGSRTIPTNWAVSGGGASYTDGQASIDGGNNAIRVQLSGNGDFSAYQATAATINTPTFYTEWVRSNSSNNSFNIVIGNGGTSASAIVFEANDWKRIGVQSIHNNIANYIIPVDAEYNGVGAVDVVVDFVQVENGAFATEAIITTSTEEIRAGERLYITDAYSCIDGGTLNCYYKLIPKGSSLEYGSNIRLWTIDGYNYCEIDSVNNTLTTVVQNNVWTTDISITWNKFDVVEIFVSVGGNIPGRAAYRLNGGDTIQLGNSDTNIFDVPGGTLDVLCNGTNNQFTGWVKFVSFWRAGRTPSWAKIPPPFFPTSISDLSLWLVSSSGVETISGDVSNWSDASGNSHDFTSFDSDVRPTFLTSGINEKPDMLYDGYKTLYGASSLNPSSAITVFGIFSTSNRNTSTIIGKGFTQSNFILGLDINGFSEFSGLGSSTGVSDFPLNDNEPHVIVGIFDNISQTYRQYIDGVKQLNTGTSIFDLLSVVYPINVGALTDDGSTIHDPFIGDISEVGIYDKALVVSEIERLNIYLLNKAGIKKQFRPDVANGLQLWFRNDFDITIDMSNIISEWDDLSSHSRNLLQSNPSNQPILEFDQNGKLIGPFFNGSNYMYWDNTNIATNAITAFAIFKTNGMVNLSQLWGKAFSSTGWSFTCYSPSGEGKIDFTIGSNTTRCDTNLDDNRLHTIVGTWDSASQIVALYVDGLLQYNSSSFNGTISGNDTIGVGAKIDAITSTASDFFVGNIIEAGVYNSVNRSSLDGLNDYLNKRAFNQSKSPKEIKGLNSWFRSTLQALNIGGLVSNWNDLSHSNLLPKLEQSDNSLQPTFITNGINNLPTIQGSGTQALVGSITPLGTTAITMFVIFKTTTSTQSTLFGMGYSQDAYKFRIDTSGILRSYITSSGNNASSNTSVNDGSSHIAIATWDNSDGYILLYIDGLLQSTSVIEMGVITTIGDANAVMAGALDNNILNEQFSGDIQEAGSYGRKITAKEVVGLSHYMARRAGISIIEDATNINGFSDIFRADTGITISGNFFNSVSEIGSIVAANIIQLIQPDVAQRPLLIDPGINSFPDIEFDGTTALYCNTINIATGNVNEITMYIIFTTIDNTSTIVGMHGTNPHYSFDLSGGVLQSNINGSVTISDNPVNDGNIHWAVMLWDAASLGGAILLYVDGILQSSSIGSTTSGILDGSLDNDRHAIGAGVSNGIASNNFIGNIAEHGTFSIKLSGNDLSNLFSYLRTRTSIQ